MQRGWVRSAVAGQAGPIGSVNARRTASRFAAPGTTQNSRSASSRRGMVSVTARARHLA